MNNVIHVRTVEGNENPILYPCGSKIRMDIVVETEPLIQDGIFV